MDEILYSTADEQVEKLLSQNLIINDYDYAKNRLELYGYSNLIKSYRDPYIITVNGKKQYRDGVTFEQIESLYILDKNLRNTVMGAMLDLEEHIKESAANIIACAFGTHQDSYLQFKNYRDKKKTKKRFTLAGILKTMRDTLNTDKNPIAHYSQEHGIVPPWILFKSIYFSTIINFIHLFKPSEQHKLANLLYDNNALNLTEEDLSKLMMDTLFVCLEYRNKAAHGGRIYNYTSDRNISILADSNSLYGFSRLLYLLDILKYSSPYNQLDHALTVEINRHCSMFPNDTTYLGQILNMNIQSTEIVWVSKKSKKFHRIPHCSGIQNAQSIPLNDAKSSGYEPCKKCCR